MKKNYMQAPAVITETTASETDKNQGNTADDGTLIGRIYEVELFDEKVTAGTLYNTEQRVDMVTMRLESPDAGIYEKALTEFFGQPEGRSAAVSETGSTYLIPVV